MQWLGIVPRLQWLRSPISQKYLRQKVLLCAPNIEPFLPIQYLVPAVARVSARMYRTGNKQQSCALRAASSCSSRNVGGIW